MSSTKVKPVLKKEEIRFICKLLLTYQPFISLKILDWKIPQSQMHLSSPTLGGKYTYIVLDRIKKIIKVYIFYLYLLGSLYCHGFGFQSYFVRLKIFELHWRVGNDIGVAWSLCFVFPSCTLLLWPHIQLLQNPALLFADTYCKIDFSYSRSPTPVGVIGRGLLSIGLAAYIKQPAVGLIHQLTLSQSYI